MLKTIEIMLNYNNIIFTKTSEKTIELKEKDMIITENNDSLHINKVSIKKESLFIFENDTATLNNIMINVLGKKNNIDENIIVEGIFMQDIIDYICEKKELVIQKINNAHELIKYFVNTIDVKNPTFKNELDYQSYGLLTYYLARFNKLEYNLKSNDDDRGSYIEMFKPAGSGQIGYSTSVPNIKRGNHFHFHKTEKFIVVNGLAKVKMRNIITNEIKEYVNLNNEKGIIMPCGWTHLIENSSKNEMHLLIWASKEFNKDKPDTYYMEV